MRRNRLGAAGFEDARQCRENGGEEQVANAMRREAGDAATDSDGKGGRGNSIGINCVCEERA